MLITYLLGGTAVIILAMLLYSMYIQTKQSQRRIAAQEGDRRDMWKASLLDCEYEPAKYVFGPGKVIPSDKTLTRDTKDEPFSSHMQKK